MLILSKTGEARVSLLFSYSWFRRCSIKTHGVFGFGRWRRVGGGTGLGTYLRGRGGRVGAGLDVRRRQHEDGLLAQRSPVGSAEHFTRVFYITTWLKSTFDSPFRFTRNTYGWSKKMKSLDLENWKKKLLKKECNATDPTNLRWMVLNSHPGRKKDGIGRWLRDFGRERGRVVTSTSLFRNPNRPFRSVWRNSRAAKGKYSSNGVSPDFIELCEIVTRSTDFRFPSSFPTRACSSKSVHRYQRSWIGFYWISWKFEGRA